jgi:hypothetical protein
MPVKFLGGASHFDCIVIRMTRWLGLLVRLEDFV